MLMENQFWLTPEWSFFVKKFQENLTKGEVCGVFELDEQEFFEKPSWTTDQGRRED